MRLKGRQLKNNNIQVVVIPRPGEDLVFYFKPVLNPEEFHIIGPREPIPPTITYRDGSKKLDTQDSKFRENLKKYAQVQNAWMFLQSISATPDLEWETVNANDPETWANVFEELKAAEFVHKEVELLFQGYQKANAFDDDQLDAARDRFLALNTQTETE